MRNELSTWSKRQAFYDAGFPSWSQSSLLFFELVVCKKKKKKRKLQTNLMKAVSWSCSMISSGFSWLRPRRHIKNKCKTTAIKLFLTPCCHFVFLESPRRPLSAVIRYFRRSGTLFLVVIPSTRHSVTPLHSYNNGLSACYEGEKKSFAVSSTY